MTVELERKIIAVEKLFSRSLERFEQIEASLLRIERKLESVEKQIKRSRNAK